MSWKHLIQTTRRLGLPTIIADEHAKNPVVILPLDQYEALVGLESDAVGRGRVVQDQGIKTSSPSSQAEAAFEIIAEDAEELLKMNQDSEMGVEEPLEKPESEGSKTPEISLEDRFYFEPLDDENKS